MSKLDEIKKALQAATPGPWEWQRKNFDETNAEGGYDVYDLMHWKNQGKPRSGIAVLTAFNDKRGYPVISAFSYQDALIISNAPEWLRFLLDELEQTRKESNMLREELHKFQELAIKAANHHKAERDKLIEALRWYADRENWCLGLTFFGPARGDNGQRARDILKEIGVTVE